MFELFQICKHEVECFYFPGHDYTVETFNILLLCSEDYVVEPQSLSFLVEHGFDFNKQYAVGIPYYRSSTTVRYIRKEVNTRQIFMEGKECSEYFPSKKICSVSNQMELFYEFPRLRVAMMNASIAFGCMWGLQ